ncbi:MAG: thrombospondin type 3 repeat-containing protein [Acidobacteriota bacterium]|nr:thrombospondin type 3 repeat-containing protein [Acidobacteriota bacterium]
MLAAAPTVGGPDPGDVAAIDRALLALYIHGVDETTAHEAVGAAGVPRILELLGDPDFPRRDNLVAFLFHLGGPDARRALVSMLDRPPASPARPEEDRALLLAPQALGKIASRGDAVALDLLLKMTKHGGDGGPLARASAAGERPAELRADLMEMALRGLALSGSPRARARLDDVVRRRVVPDLPGRSLDRAADAALALWDELHAHSSPGLFSPNPKDGDDPGSPGPGEVGGQSEGASLNALDTQTSVHDSGLSYANHPAVTNPMTDARLDDVLAGASLRSGRGDFAGDVACCVTLSRAGTQQSFGSVGDGLDVIDTDPELNSVLNNPVARVKVVRTINFCGSSVPNIIGCAWTPGNGVAIVRLTNINTEAITWIHEFGHNTGLGHSGDSRLIMYGTNYGTNDGMTQVECDAFHSPSVWTELTPVNTGACLDGDGDDVHDQVDNCPSTTNTSQTDGDGDGAGTACDNCPSDPNPPQADFDVDGTGDVCDGDDDNDGVGDGSDCAPFDPAAWSIAGQSSSLGFLPGSKTDLSWTAGSQAAVSNLYIGSMGPSFSAAWSCLAADLPGSTYTDSTELSAGQGLHYLATAENACGESGAGEDSSGGSRAVASCP